MNSDVILVFLSRHGRLPPAWVEEQDLPRVQRLVEALTDMSKAERGTDPDPTPTDQGDMALGRW